MIAALSGKIANLREMKTDGTIGKTLHTTGTIKIGSNVPETLTGTKINLVGTTIPDVAIGHINMDTTEFLETSWFSFAADFYLDDFSPTIVHIHIRAVYGMLFLRTRY